MNKIIFNSSDMLRYLLAVKETDSFQHSEKLTAFCFKKRMYFKNTLVKNEGISVEAKDFNLPVSKKTIESLIESLTDLEEQRLTIALNEESFSGFDKTLAA